MRYVLFIIVLVGMLIVAGCVQPRPAKSKIPPSLTSSECKYDTCNGICYYNGSQKCCGGHLYKISDGACCAGIMHDSHKDMGTCCGGKWYSYGTKGECCPNKLVFDDFTQNYEAVWIDTTIQHCCAGKVAAGGKKAVKIPSYGEWKDCGNSCFDTSSQSCCLSDAGQMKWTASDIRDWSWDPNITLTVYEGTNRCCTHGYLKLCAEGMRCCYKDFGASEASCEDLKSKYCDINGYNTSCDSAYCRYTRLVAER
jgi:hypothetical protein